MKSYKEVEKTRLEYHREPTLNSVHRSSLIAPSIAGSDVEVSLLNHFLLKRGYKDVGCRISSIGKEGQRLASYCTVLDEPRVYTVRLAEFTKSDPELVSAYNIEFFSGNNLFIPFPAVMVNHVGSGFLNLVHSYNRVLNDVFEDDAINKTHVSEASIDLRSDEGGETFFVFTAGAFPVDGKMSVCLDLPNANHVADIPVNVPRFGTKLIGLKDAFPNLVIPREGVLKIRQPSQTMFYGRLLVGQRSGDAFSANHSFYDSSSVREYSDDARPSYRLYPHFPGFDVVLRAYPVQSPSLLRLTVEYFDKAGRLMTALPFESLRSPSGGAVEIPITSAANRAGIPIDDLGGFGLRATPEDGMTPTRINHQVVYNLGKLESSVTVSLANPNDFCRPGAGSVAWGMASAGGGFDSMIGIMRTTPNSGDAPPMYVEISLFTERGLLGTPTAVRLVGGAAHVIGVADALSRNGFNPSTRTNVWYYAKSAQPGVQALSLVWNHDSRHCSGEHSF